MQSQTGHESKNIRVGIDGLRIFAFCHHGRVRQVCVSGLQYR